ncbi:PhoH family protein, partial [Mycolicibacterium smegmatis]|uniref:PhoH family protein n=1 Tax=Mycolicibacterium smegmatis TaxID=1772 RepID=UPI0023DABC26
LEVLPLTHIRGRSLHDSFVIVDEAQSLERNVLLTVLSRLGAGADLLEHLGDQRGDRRAFAALQRHVGEQRVPLELLDHRGH